MWKVYKWFDKDVLDSVGCIIYKKGWVQVGTYPDMEAVQQIIEHDIYLYNCTCDENTPNPKYKILSNFDEEEK